jgi:8-oxo-dGTP pyrophosphatase MutT (NUDIX family)
MARTPIYAAGGIVVRGGRRRPLIAVVQRSKDEAWVLPRGKLKRDEDPVVGARREVVEETGHRVHVHEFVGAITYRARGRPKVVQFWRMQAYERPSRDVMKDIVAVEWLPLSAAVRRLSYPLEKLFLQFAGRRALKRRKRAGKKKKKKTHARRKTNVAAIRKRKPAQPRRKTRARKTGARKTSTQKPRAHKTRKPQRTTPRAHHQIARACAPRNCAAAQAAPPRANARRRRQAIDTHQVFDAGSGRRGGRVQPRVHSDRRTHAARCTDRKHRGRTERCGAATPHDAGTCALPPQPLSAIVRAPARSRRKSCQNLMSAMRQISPIRTSRSAGVHARSGNFAA